MNNRSLRTIFLSPVLTNISPNKVYLISFAERDFKLTITTTIIRNEYNFAGLSREYFYRLNSPVKTTIVYCYVASSSFSSSNVVLIFQRNPIKVVTILKIPAN